MPGSRASRNREIGGSHEEVLDAGRVRSMPAGDRHADNGTMPGHAAGKIQIHRRQCRGNVMKTWPSVVLGSFASLLMTMAIPASVAQVNQPVSASPTLSGAPMVRATFYYSAAMAGVDCIGDGASCEGFLRGSEGEVIVTNNVDRRYHWRFKLTCDFGGDQIGEEKFPAAGAVSSRLTCKFGALAKYWNVLVDYRP